MPTPTLPADAAALDLLTRRMLGNPSTFFRRHWRMQPFFAPAVGDDWAGSYGVEDFLADMVATQPSPYLAVSARDGKRLFSRHATPEGLHDAVRDGAVSAMKASRIWHNAMPQSWAWMRALFGSLCHAAAMIYMNSPRSEDVDIFLAGPRSSLGTHFDTTDVFTLQLFGERRWVVEEKVDLDAVLGLARDPDWYPAREIDFHGPTQEFLLRPGDALYVPAFGVHRVMGVSWSVSLSLGLRAFNEIDVVEHLLEGIRLMRYMDYGPLQSLPESEGEAHADAKLDLVRRVRSLLAQVEGAAMAKVLAPLNLPKTLSATADLPGTDRVPEEVQGVFRSGFALDEEKANR